MKKIFICLLVFFCMMLNSNDNVYAAKTQPLTEEQQKEVNAFAGYVEHLMDIKSYSWACATAYELTRRYPNEPVGYFLLGTARMDSGYYEPAIVAFNDCLKVDKKYFDAYIHRGLSNYQMGKYKEAVKDYNRALRLSNATKYDKALAYANRAMAKYHDGDYKEAIKDFNTIIKITPDLKTIDSVYYNRGLCRYHSGDIAGAEADYNKAKELNPKSKYIYYDKQDDKNKNSNKTKIS